MESKETQQRPIETQTVLEDVDYFKYIFKKTEKIICAIFYVARTDLHIGQNDLIIKDLEETALQVLKLSLMSLKDSQHVVKQNAHALRIGLIELESKLRLMCAVQHMSTDLLEVFLHEIGSVQRSLRRYIDSGVRNPLMQNDVNEKSILLYQSNVRKHTARPKHAGISSETHSNGHIKDRRERVLSVIREKLEASIKDICEVVSDCSEKTIQRELNDLIVAGLVVREGERRWSKYKLSV
jgi:DNA-binding transcriptional ArsR family regulator